MLDADAVIHQLYQTTRAISKDLNQRFDAEGLFSSEWSLISVLRKRGPMSQASLAGYLNIEAPAISKTLLRLEEKGLIARKTGASRREKLVSLTPEAETRSRCWERIIETHHADLFKGIGEKDLERFMTVLETLSRNVDGTEEE